MPLFGSALDGPGLVAEMDRFGIAMAAVTHSFGRELDAPRGNAALLALLDDVDPEGARLVPVVTLFPPHGLVDAGVEDQLAIVESRPLLAARLHPNPTHDVMDEDVHPRHYPLVAEVTGGVCAVLEARGIVLLLEMAEIRWEEVY